MRAVNSILRMKRITNGKHWVDGYLYDYSIYDEEPPFYRFRHIVSLYCYQYRKHWIGELPF